jgi:sec-independent protein translocase protein TatA
MNLGPAEILVILVVALVVFGPKRLPEVSRQIGGAMRELRKVQDSVRAEIDSALHDDDEPPAAREVRHARAPELAPVHDAEADADHDDVVDALPPERHDRLEEHDNGPSGSFS